MFLKTINPLSSNAKSASTRKLSTPALRAALRQDPDVIMIGELRDAITFAAAMNSADTGQMVLSTVHTTNASQSITRILDYFKADEREQVRRQLSVTLRAVVCQRMVPTLDGKMTPACEIMLNTPIVRKLIEENRLDKLSAAIETGHDDGMQDFNKAVLELLQRGTYFQGRSHAQGRQPCCAGDEPQRHLPVARQPNSGLTGAEFHVFPRG